MESSKIQTRIVCICKRRSGQSDVNPKSDLSVLFDGFQLFSIYGTSSIWPYGWWMNNSLLLPAERKYFRCWCLQLTVFIPHFWWPNPIYVNSKSMFGGSKSLLLQTNSTIFMATSQCLKCPFLFLIVFDTYWFPKLPTPAAAGAVVVACLRVGLGGQQHSHHSLVAWKSRLKGPKGLNRNNGNPQKKEIRISWDIIGCWWAKFICPFWVGEN